MKVTFERETLSRVLSVVERVLPNKAAMPIYQALYIGAKGRKAVEFKVTNGDQFLSLQVAADVDAKRGEGVALPGEEFLRLVKVAPAAEVKLTVLSDKAQVASGGAEWVLRYLTGVSWSDAPQALSDGSEEQSVVPMGLREALRKVQYSVARTQNRPSFRQVMIGDGSVVAADGRRAHVVEGLEFDGKFLIPEAVVDVVLDLLDLIGEDSAALGTSEEGWVRLSSEKVDFVTGRLAYEWPDVQRVMVKKGRDQKGHLKLSRSQLVTAVMVASVAEDEGSVKLSVSNGKMRVESESGQMKAHMDFEIEGDLGEKWERWFTSELLKEMMGAFGEGEIEFKVSLNGDDAGVLYAEEGAECAVLMPLSR